MQQNGADHPYKTIGWHLKFAREQLKETRAEVCSAVEIDEQTLSLIEDGEQRPSEDVLLLLISHLHLEDAEATSLWSLAGYEDDEPQPNIASSGSPVVYTDKVQVAVNDYGLVMNFMQTNGSPAQFYNIASVGMSKDYARLLLEILQAALNHPDQKQESKFLPAPKKRADKN